MLFLFFTVFFFASFLSTNYQAPMGLVHSIHTHVYTLSLLALFYLGIT